MYIKNHLNYSESALSKFYLSSKNVEIQWLLFKSKCKDYCEYLQTAKWKYLKVL